MKRVYYVKKVAGVPSPVAHYCTAAKVLHPAEWVFPSGILPLGEKGQLARGIEAQTKQALENMEKILRDVGFRLEDIVKVNVMLKSMGDFQKFNQIYTEFMGDVCPARAAYGQAEIALGALVEIEVIAAN
ncbi:MAG: RidA family protein [Candidatus Gracilibacteria bacterium]|nr:RidA family protein [Candidatus Gracilibacteria bacterium]